MNIESLLFLRALSVEWERIPQDSYLRGIPAIASIRSLSFPAPVTFFAGENGTGKSTLLEAAAVALGFNPEGGTRNYRFSTYDSHSALSDALRLQRGVRRPRYGYFLRAESFYNVATKEEEYSREPGGIPLHLHEKSHGESFLLLAHENFKGGGLYLLDEPEAALSPQRQLTLLSEIHRCSKAGAQFIIATHSPILLGLPGAGILSFDGERIHPVLYEETDSYRITSLFVNERGRLLRQLLEEEP